jgi:uncharacterized protein (DUF885 family)
MSTTPETAPGIASVSEISERYIEEFSVVDPTYASRMGIGGSSSLTDFSPTGTEAMAELLRSTEKNLKAATPTSEAERLGSVFLRASTAAQLAMIESGERECRVSILFGPTAYLRMSFDVMNRSSDEGWERIAERLDEVPQAIQQYRVSLQLGLDRGTTASKRMALSVADQCSIWASNRWFSSFVKDAPTGLRDRCNANAERANRAYGELSEWLRTSYVPLATEEDGVGKDRYRIWSQWMLGTELDIEEAYAWGAEELARLEREKASECERIRRGATFAEVRTLLNTDPSLCLETVDAYRGWLQDMTDTAISGLGGTEFEIPHSLRRCEAAIPAEGSAAAPYYTPPSEDFLVPGRVWFPTQGRTVFPKWDQLTTVYHEGVPGHHLQMGGIRNLSLTRAHRVGFNSAHGEGWALYAERLMDELGGFATPDVRLGFLCMQAFRAARVVVDIGLHTGARIPFGYPGEGEPWTFDRAVTFIQHAGGKSKEFAESEVNRYLSAPSQATSYKLGERAWLDGRDQAQRKYGTAFDRKSWHARALALGPLGLDDLAKELVLL